MRQISPESSTQPSSSNGLGHAAQHFHPRPGRQVNPSGRNLAFYQAQLVSAYRQLYLATLDDRDAVTEPQALPAS